MTLRVALLRGVNVGGNKKVSMAELKALFEALGFTEVKTLLQSGNVVFRAGGESDSALEKRLEVETEKRLGQKTSYLVRDARAWRALIDANPFPKEAEAEPSRTLVTIGRAAMPAEALEAVRAVMRPPEKLEAVGRDVYAYFGEGMGQSKAAEVLNRKAIKAVATGRNWNTVLKIAALLGV
ncbi:MAG TPA: DUF1697 domain-containing protein [Caulobacter sp.]|nr:DUF1697 domain-containing protein [Caulobacter sp.]